MYQSMYHRKIQDMAPGFDPRHVEAYMRVGLVLHGLKHSTLDGLSAADFRAEVQLCCHCIVDGGIDAAESCAQSFGL